jgi:hypothetical protein
VGCKVGLSGLQAIRTHCRNLEVVEVSVGVGIPLDGWAERCDVREVLI